jgi:hypothetical protein
VYYLYIKTHNVTGLNYLGQTQQDPFTYKGSGLYWKRHYKEHGYDVTTKVILETESYNTLVQEGTRISKKFNIVDSKEWANLTDETGNGINSAFSSKLQKQRVKDGTIPQLFTSESATAYNLSRVKNGTHPFVGGKYTKEYNKRALADGTHPFLNKENRDYNRRKVSESRKRQAADGTHNFIGKIPVVDVHGRTHIISKQEYYDQKDKYLKQEDYPFVSTSSKEAKRRRLKK